MNKIDKLCDSVNNILDFVRDHMLWFLGIPLLLDVLLIGAYFAFGFENFILINSVFVVNFIGIGILALYVLNKFILLPIVFYILYAIAEAKEEKGRV